MENNPSKLIKWTELSKIFGFSKQAIRPGNVPEIHRSKVERLLQVIRKEIESW